LVFPPRYPDPNSARSNTAHVRGIPTNVDTRLAQVEALSAFLQLIDKRRRPNHASRGTIISNNSQAAGQMTASMGTPASACAGAAAKTINSDRPMRRLMFNS
jgi:hypothetical protein